jgi:serine/threonine protein phosphatase PrpC
VISNVPDFTEQTIDFDLDQFLVLATDGVFDFVSFEQVGKLISNAERTEKGLKKAAEEILTLAKSQGSADDRTCVIVDFTWARRFSPVQQEEVERESEKDTSDPDDDDIFNIHQN